MRWLSIDPAEKAGLAWWEDDKLIGTALLRPAKGKEKKMGEWAIGDVVAPTFRAALRSMIIHVEAVFIEESMGKSPKTVAQLGEFRGYVRALCDEFGVPYKAANTKEWQHIVGGLYGLSFPNNSQDGKRLSIKLALDFCKRELTADEADAVNVGRWALRTGKVMEPRVVDARPVET